jgi:hypothetical protein
VKLYPYFPNFWADSDETQNRSRHLMLLSSCDFGKDWRSESRKLLEGVNEILPAFYKILFHLEET